MQKISNTTFANTVRDIVRSIPKGTTFSYGRVAELAGKPKAVRAVARIMSTNYDVSIPCHRVVRADGTLGGYNRGGAKVKRALIEAEKTS